MNTRRLTSGDTEQAAELLRQGRLTDHRVGLTLYKLDAVMDGDLDEIIDALTTARQAEQLAERG